VSTGRGAGEKLKRRREEKEGKEEKGEVRDIYSRPGVKASG